MKRTLILLCAAICAAILTVSCAEFLDTYPNDALSPATAWKTEADANKFLTGCYSGWLWGEEFFYLDCASDIGFSYHTHEGWRVIADGSMTPGNPGHSFFDYETVRRCIAFLDNIDRVTFANEADKKNMVAQVKTILAYQYFKMNWWYGGVPVISAFSSAEEAQVPRETEAKVKEYVYRNIDEAVPDIASAPAAGYLAKGAALALKMRSALYYADYARARDAARAIKALNLYVLEPDYANIFTLAGRGSREIILSHQRMKPGAAEWIITVPNNGDGGWSSMVPSRNLVDIYEMSNGLTREESGSGYDSQHPFAGRDPRMSKTLLYPGRDWASAHNKVFNTLDPTLPDGSKNPDHPASADNASKTGLTWAKFLLPIEQYGGDFESTETQYIVYRYAEVLLTLAEASNELDGPSPEAYDAIDAIRGRAGMPAVNRTKYNTKEKLRELIRRERTVELAGEGHRRADILRWKDASGKMLAETLMNGDLTRYTGTVNYSEPDPFKRASVTGTERIETRKFAPYNRYLPIPEDNRNKNPKLDQNPGY